MRIAGLAIALVLGTAAPAVAADPFFGIYTENVSLPRDKQRLELDRQAATGVGTIREPIFWDRIETSPGFYDWRRLDDLVADAADRGLTLLPVLLYTPRFYRPAGGGPLAPPADNSKLAQFAMKLVQRYGRKGHFWACNPDCRQPYLPIIAWQVWNEPNYAAWWKGRPNAKEYVDMLTAVYTGIKLVDPFAEVVTGGLARTAADDGYLTAFYQHGGGLVHDTLAFHPYGESVERMVHYVRRFRAVADAHLEGNTPMWITEYGWATGGRGAFVAPTEECHAALLHAGTRRLYDLRSELKIKSVVQFMWNDRPATNEIWPYFAGLVRIDGTPKPALDSFTQAVAGETPPSLSSSCPPAWQPLG